MTYFESGNVIAYPASNRGLDYPRSVYTSEINLANIIKSVTDKESFILPTTTLDGNIEVILGGYYFKINKSLNALSNGSYGLGIKLDSSNENFPNLINIETEDNKLDNDGNFYGIELSNNDSGYTCWLHLGVKEGNEFKLDPESKIKITADSVKVSSDSSTNIVNLKDYINEITEKFKALPSIYSYSKKEYNEGGLRPDSPKEGDLLLVYED